MALVRAYQFGDAPVRILYPNRGKFQPVDETAEEYLARMAAIAEARDPSLVRGGTVTVDVDTATLPTERVRGNGGGTNVRAGWRIQGGAVVIDETKVISR